MVGGGGLNPRKKFTYQKKKIQEKSTETELHVELKSDKYFL